MRKRVLIAVILSMVMILGTGVLGYADPPGINGCECSEALVTQPIIKITSMDDTSVYYNMYDHTTGNYSGTGSDYKFMMPNVEIGKVYHYVSSSMSYVLCNSNPYVEPLPETGTPSSPAHVHTFTWQTICEATPNSDGLEGEVCSCGATRNTQPISAMDYAINKYADQMIKAAKPGQKITLEFGEFNSFPRYMMEKVAARMNENITFVFKFKQNKKMQTVTIEPGTAIDLQYDWYGPDKMKELYGAE